MWLIWIVLIVVLVLVLRAAVGTGPSQGGTPQRNAREILDERYARGEIDQDEYERKRRDLDG